VPAGAPHRAVAFPRLGNDGSGKSAEPSARAEIPAERSSRKDDEASDHRNGWVHASGRLQMQTDGYDMVL